MRRHVGQSVAIIGVAVVAIVIIVVVLFILTFTKDVNVQSDMNQVQSIAMSCVDAGGKLLSPESDSAICTKQDDVDAMWPTLPPGWGYAPRITSSPNRKIFSFSARGDNVEITCTHEKCTINK